MTSPQSLTPSRSRAQTRIRRLAFPLVLILGFALSAPVVLPGGAQAQEARRRWEMMAQIRRDKFDYVLPEVMRENGVDMWITVMREGLHDPLYEDLGRGYIGGTAYYIFTDRGEHRIERAALGADGYFLSESGAYDIITGQFDIREFVTERDPGTIAVNMADNIGAADGLSHTSYLSLIEALGEPYASRLVSAEKLISDFRSRRVATEIIAFGETAELSRHLAERAFSNEVITPGVTTLEDVGWWIMEEIRVRGLDTSFDMPSIYITGPEGIEAVTTDRIIQRGDLLMIDWGVGLMNFHNDMKRIAYVLEEGETAAPAGIQHAFDQAMKVRDVIRDNIVVGRTAADTLEVLNMKIEDAGFSMMANFNQTRDDDSTEVIIGCHSVGNTGHGIGPSIAWFNPKRLEFEIRPTNILSIELFAYTPAPEWGGKKVRIPLEDDAIVTERGIEWLYPVNQRILLIK